MTDRFSVEKRSEIMRRVKSKDTSPEKIVRAILFKHGYRYKLHYKNLPGKPDIVMHKYNSVIFVNGCFWHMHKCKNGKRTPKSHIDYWLPKLNRNVERFNKNKRILRKLGWNVIVIWECQINTWEELKLHEYLIKNISKI